jgi:ABC-2 type transport system ATP-binding protein
MYYGSRRARSGRITALADVSFEVGQGEIVALLGPNGAGKTTMMRILSGFLAPSEGDAQLAGHSIRDDGLNARRQVGYLPEGVALYPDMRVGEYLGYRARLRGVRRADRDRLVERAIDRCGLGERRRQIIGTLSRGYRQRIGLADAILARPPILILDEPTVGLDPNQIREVRQLIRELAREQTVLLSTHILSEVEALAARVLILHRGRMVAARTPAELRAPAQGSARLLVEVRPAELERAQRLFRALPAVTAVEPLSECRLALELAGDGAPEPQASPAAHTKADAGGAMAAPVEDPRDAVFRAAMTGGVSLRELRWESSSLEEIFARITTGAAEPPDA